MSGERDAVGTSTDAYGNKQTDAFYTRDASGNPTSLAGTPGWQFGLQSPAFVDVGEARLVEQLSSTLTVPTYVVADDSVVHPSVIRIAGGWNGYEYWMAMTPYSNSDSQYENPSILASNDGKTWVVPTGVTNPLVAYPGGTNYNSDPYLFFTPDGYLCIFWRQVVGTNVSLKYIKSANGITWGAEATSLTTVRASEDLASPSIIWEASNNQYRMYANDISASPYTIKTATAPSLAGPWSARTSCTYTYPSGYTTSWHTEFRPLGNNTNLGLIQFGDSTGGNVYAASAIGSDISVGNRVSKINSTMYKSSLVIYPDRTIGVWLGSLAGPTLAIEYGTVAFDLTAYNRARSAYWAALSTGTLPVLGSAITWDSFNRADGALGTPTAGTAYTIESGGFNITSNAVTGASAANNKVYVASGVTDIYMRAQFYGASNTHWLTFRRVDNNNFWRAQIFNSNVVFQRVVAGSITYTQTKSVGTNSAGDVLEIVCRGNCIQVLYQGILHCEKFDSTHSTGTGHGFQITNTSDTLDNFLLASL